MWALTRFKIAAAQLRCVHGLSKSKCAAAAGCRENPCSREFFGQSSSVPSYLLPVTFLCTIVIALSLESRDDLREPFGRLPCPSRDISTRIDTNYLHSIWHNSQAKRLAITTTRTHIKIIKRRKDLHHKAIRAIHLHKLLLRAINNNMNLSLKDSIIIQNRSTTISLRPTARTSILLKTANKTSPTPSKSRNLCGTIYGQAFW